MSDNGWREKVGQHVEARRKELHLSVRTAAKRAGFSPTLWYWVEKGTMMQGGHEIPANPKPETRAAIAAALAWPADALDNLEAGKPPYDPAEAIIGDEALAARLSNGFAESFMEAGPAGIPDYAVNDEEYVRTLPAEMFAILMLERARRQSDARIATLEAQMRALRPVVRELANHATLDVDDELRAILSEGENGEDSPQEM